jgi:hypothetical protein
MTLPPSEAHAEPLSETSISALFGPGDLSRRNLIKAWLDDGIRHMNTLPVGTPVKEVLRARLEFNEPVLQHLPEARDHHLLREPPTLMKIGIRSACIPKAWITSPGPSTSS